MTNEEWTQLVSDFVSEVEWFGHCIGEGNLSDAMESMKSIDGMKPAIKTELYLRAERQ
jgi:hypothetical protein